MRSPGGLVDALLAEGAGEEAWVDAYHREVWEAVAPRLDAFGSPASAKEWLRRSTRPLREQLAEVEAGVAGAPVEVAAA